MDKLLKLPVVDSAGKFDVAMAVGFLVAVAASVMLLRAVPLTAKLIK